MTAPARPSLARLGLTAATAIVVANMVGTGVFTSTGYQASSLHDPTAILIAWVIGGVLALCGAAAYAELGAMMPKVGGEYVYLREAYHPVVGFLSGWTSLFAGFSAPIAVSALAFAHYLAVVFPQVAAHQPLVAIALIVAMTALHGFDTVLGGRVQTGFTVAKTVLIIVFIVAGLTVGDGNWDHLPSQGGGTSNVWTEAFAMALMFVSFAYSGWNAAAYIAGEIRDPARTLPRALLFGTALVMALYVLLNVVFFYALPSTVLASGNDGGPVIEVGARTAEAMFGGRAGTLLTTLIALALISAVSAMVMAGPRVYAAMADDEALPPVLGWRSRRGVPVVAVLVQGVLASAVVLIADLGQIIRYVGFTLSIFTALTVAAVFVLRVQRPAAPRPYRTLGYPVTPVLFIVLSGWVAYVQIHQKPYESLWGLGTLAVGLVVYGVMRTVAGHRHVPTIPVAQARDRDSL